MGLAQKSSDAPSANSKKEKICIQEGKKYRVRTSGIIGDSLLFASKNHFLRVLSIIDTPKCNVPPYIIISFEGGPIRTTKDEVLSIISDSNHIKDIKKKKHFNKKRA